MIRFLIIFGLLIAFSGCNKNLKVHTTKRTGHLHGISMKHVRENVKNVVFVYTRDSSNKLISSGTGFIINKKEGLILTVFHVLRYPRTEKIYVKFKENGRWITKKVIWHINAKKYDMSLFYVNHTFKSQVKIRYRPLVTGEPLFTIGYADPELFWRGIYSSVKPRIAFGDFYLISYYRRKGGINSFMQVSNMHIVGGASGSPVFDKMGRVVGIISLSKPLKKRSTFTWSIPITHHTFLLKQRKNLLKSPSQVIKNPAK